MTTRIWKYHQSKIRWNPIRSLILIQSPSLIPIPTTPICNFILRISFSLPPLLKSPNRERISVLQIEYILVAVARPDPTWGGACDEVTQGRRRVDFRICCCGVCEVQTTPAICVEGVLCVQ